MSARGQAALAEVLEPLQLYELKDPLPRAFTIGSYSVDLDPERLRTRLESPGYDPRALALLSEELPAAVARLAAGSGRRRRAAPLSRSVGERRRRIHTSCSSGPAAARASWS